MFGRLDITRDQHRFSARLFDMPFGLSGIVFFIEISD
jgi:hypothetical protein